MKTSRDFEELFGLLNEHEVDYLIVGAHAVAFHAKPRYTKDIDVFVRPTDENAVGILEALNEFGFGGLGLDREDFTDDGNIVQLGVPPNRIDFLTSLSGLSFEEAWSGRVEGTYGKQDVYYVGKDSLVKNKKATGRPQDAIDIQWLQEDS